MQEVNPYRLQYIPAPDHSAQLYEEMVAPQRFMQQQEENKFRHAQLERETSRDVRNDERERVGQRQRAQEMLMQDKRAGQREDLYSLSENRRERVDQLNRQHLAEAEHEKLIQDLYNASNTGDPRAVQFAIDALQRAGYNTEEMQHTQAMPEPAPPVAPAVQTAPHQHLSPKETGQVGSSLDAAEKRILPQLSGKSPMPKKATAGRDEALSRQLDGIDQKYTAGLSGPSAPTPWLPGQSPVQRRAPSVGVAQSDAMLDPDDPYNKLVQ